MPINKFLLVWKETLSSVQNGPELGKELNKQCLMSNNKQKGFFEHDAIDFNGEELRSGDLLNCFFGQQQQKLLLQMLALKSTKIGSLG